VDAGGVKAIETFVVDSDGWSHAQIVDACRLILRAVQCSVSRYETDVPTTSGDWPPDVVAAADVLRGVATRTGRVESQGYARTGAIRAVRDEVWSAFVTFAPWSYDATVWDVDGHDSVSFADEGESVVVRLDRHRYDAIAAVLGETRLVPEDEWRRRLKQRRKHQA